MESFGPDPNSFNFNIFNPIYFQYLTEPVSYDTLRNTAVTNIPGTTSYIKSTEVNLGGVIVQEGNLQVNTDIIGNASTTITAGIAQIPNITTVNDHLIIQAASNNNIYFGYSDGNGDIYVNSNTQSKLYVDGGDFVMNGTNQKIRMGTSEMYFNDNNAWTATELKAEKIKINNVDLENKLTTVSNDIVLNKQDADSHFALVEQTAEINKTALETSIAYTSNALNTSINNVSTTLTEQIANNQTQNNTRFNSIETTAETNRENLQTAIDTTSSSLTNAINSVNNSLTQTINTNKAENDARFLTVEQTAATNKLDVESSISSASATLTNSINSVSSSLTQTINTNKADSDARFLTVEQTAATNKAALESSISSVNSSLTNSINSVNSFLSQTINTNKTDSDTRFLTIENAAASNQVLLETSISQLNSKVDNNKTAIDSSFNSLQLSKADIVYVDTKVSQLVGSAPELLNSLSELAAAIGNDNNFSSSIVSLIGTKADKTYTDAQLNLLQTDINTRALSSYVDNQLNTKVNTTDLNTYKAQVTSALSEKATIVDVSNNISNLASQLDTTTTSLTSQIALKVDNTDFVASNTSLQSQIDTKPSTVYVNGELDKKVNATAFDAYQTQVSSALDSKATSSALSTAVSSLQSSIDTKATTTYVDGQLALKSNLVDVDASFNSLQSQLNNTYTQYQIDNALNLKANQSDLDSNVTNLQGQINEKISTYDATAALALKADLSQLQSTEASLVSSINSKASTSYVNQELLLKANVADVQTAVDNLTQSINTKASTSYVNGELALKSNKTYVDDQIGTLQSSIALKSDKTYVDDAIQNLIGTAPSTLDTLQEISNAIAEDANFSVTIINAISQKASKTYVDTELASLQGQVNNKASTSYVDQQLALKGDLSYIDSELALKSNTSDVNSALALKADLIDVSNNYALKSFVNSEILSTKSYVDQSVSGLASELFVTNKAQQVKDEILNGASAAYDTLLELQTALTGNNDAVTTITTELSSKASTTYVDNAVTNLQSNLTTELNSKASITYVDTQIASIPPAPSLTGYATETYVTNAIQNAATQGVDLTTYATKTYVDTAVANVSVDLTGYATETFVTNAVSTAKSEILGGAGPAYDTLNELNALIQSGDSSVSTALASQIALKANDSEVVHLTGTEEIGGIKSFTNNITVPSVNNVSATTLSYLDATSSVQTQLNAKADSDTVVNLSTAQTIGGAKTFTGAVVVPSLNGISSTTLGYLDATSSIQTQLNAKLSAGSVVDLATNDQTITGSKIWNNLNSFSRSVERIQQPTLSGSSFTHDFTSHAISYIIPSSTTGLTCSITNIPLSTYQGGSFTISLLINTGSFKTYASAINVNGQAQTIRWIGGSSTINVANATFVLQTITVLTAPATSTVLGVLSSVTQWF